MERASLTALQGLRDDIIVPLLHLMVLFCLAMSVLLIVKKVFIIIVKLFKKRPEWRYIWEPMREKDEVLIHIPMYNEKEVYQLSIGAACGLSWTSDRIIIQVLHDSTDSVIKARVKVMEDEKENERNKREGGSKSEAMKNEKRKQEEKGKRKVMEDERNLLEDERNQERNQEEERERGSKVEATKHEVKTTEEKGKRKREGDTVEERKSKAKRRKEGPAVIDDKKPGRQRKNRGVGSCMAMGCAAIAGFTTSALILMALANIRYVKEETVYLFPT